MHLLIPVLLSLFATMATASANGHSSSQMKRRHHMNRAHSAAGQSEIDGVQQNVTTRSLERRFSGARLTFYDAGLGACGQYNSNSDYIVALNSAQWDGGSHCSKTITLTANGVTKTATIMDECPGCPFGGLDLARGFFTVYAPESAGVLSGTWSFDGEGNSAPPPSSPPPPPPPKPTTTHTPPPPKTSSPPPPPPPPPPPTTTSSIERHTTSSSVVVSSRSSSVVHATSTGSTSHSESTQSTHSASASQPGSANATPTAAGSAPLNSDNLAQMYNVFVQMGSLVVAGGGSS